MNALWWVALVGVIALGVFVVAVLVVVRAARRCAAAAAMWRAALRSGAEQLRTIKKDRSPAASNETPVRTLGRQ